MPVVTREQQLTAVDIANFILMKHGDIKTATDKKGKPMKALNAFMAFRSYYNGLFSKVQQKERSGYMTYLWKNDPCQNKWYILAKAYSVIRDMQGKAHSPIQIFLQVNAPFIKVAEPANYIGRLGYVIDTVVDAGGAVLSHHLFATDMPVEKELLLSNVSVQDVIANSINFGYVKTHAFMPAIQEPLTVMIAMNTQERPIPESDTSSLQPACIVVGGANVPGMPDAATSTHGQDINAMDSAAAAVDPSQHNDTASAGTTSTTGNSGAQAHSNSGRNVSNVNNDNWGSVDNGATDNMVLDNDDDTNFATNALFDSGIDLSEFDFSIDTTWDPYSDDAFNAYEISSMFD